MTVTDKVKVLNIPQGLIAHSCSKLSIINFLSVTGLQTIREGYSIDRKLIVIYETNIVAMQCVNLWDL